MREKLDKKILEKLKEKTNLTKQSIRNAVSRTRIKYPSLTLNASAEVYAKKKNFSISRFLDDRDRESLKTVEIEKIKVKSKSYKKRSIIEMARYESDSELLRDNIKEINKTYTYGCYTATFILCRKVLENLLIKILKKKYKDNKKEHKEKYYDINKRRYLDFSKLLENLLESKNDFDTDNKLVKRIHDRASEFKETSDEMAHSLYHIAIKKEIDESNFQKILDLIKDLENKIEEDLKKEE